MKPFVRMILVTTLALAAGCASTLKVDNAPVAALDLNDVNKRDKDVEDLEKEMWERFYGTGFWRSPSQREPLPLPLPGSANNTASSATS